MACPVTVVIPLLECVLICILAPICLTITPKKRMLYCFMTSHYNKYIVYAISFSFIVLFVVISDRSFLRGIIRCYTERNFMCELLVSLFSWFWRKKKSKFRPIGVCDAPSNRTPNIIHFSVLNALIKRKKKKMRRAVCWKEVNCVERYFCQKSHSLCLAILLHARHLHTGEK